MSLMLSVSGCRGVVGETLTPEVAARFAGSFAGWLRDRGAGRAVTVVVGRDGRAGGEVVRMAAIAGIAAAGARVVDLGVAMTPTVAAMTDSYSRREGGVVAGMVLTASHNPQQWNGLKCLLAEGGLHGSAACAPPAVLAGEIIERFKSARPGLVGWEQLGSVVQDDSGVDEHIGRIMEAMAESGLCDTPEALGDGLSVAVDCVNASGAVGAPRLLEALGCAEILPLNTSSSGLFPHPPEPTAENLGMPGGLADAVREAGADVGFAQDPDADRLALIDETGRYVGEEYTLALGAMALLSGSETAKRRGTETGMGEGAVLVTNLSTSRMLDDVAARFGVRVMRTAVGEANVVETMKRERALAGGEGNGGVIWPRVAYVRDSLSAMALTVWLMSAQGGGHGARRRLSDLVRAIPSYAIEKRKVSLARREDAAQAVERVAAAYASQHVDRQDGAWVDFRNGPLAGRAWLHVRASNTEPIMRLIAEAPTSAAANGILDEAARVIG
jgi:phosphomannomutase